MNINFDYIALPITVEQKAQTIELIKRYPYEVTEEIPLYLVEETVVIMAYMHDGTLYVDFAGFDCHCITIP